MLASTWFGSFGFDEVFFVFVGVAYNAVVRKNEYIGFGLNTASVRYLMYH